jgi:hypothetical protein
MIFLFSSKKFDKYFFLLLRSSVTTKTRILFEKTNKSDYVEITEPNYASKNKSSRKNETG